MLKWIIFKKMFYNLGKTITTSKNFQGRPVFLLLLENKTLTSLTTAARSSSKNRMEKYDPCALFKLKALHSILQARSNRATDSFIISSPLGYT